MSRLKNRVGQKIKKLRHKKGITQEQLAENANVSVDFISLIERGKNAPSLESLEKIAKALHVEASELLKDTDE